MRKAFFFVFCVLWPCIVFAQSATAWNIEDFGEGVEVHGEFNAGNPDEWDQMVVAVRRGGSNKNYIINITSDFAMKGFTENVFGPVSGIKVSIRGVGKTISVLSTETGSLIIVGNNQNVILRDVGLKGLASNNVPLVRVDGTGSVTMKGSSSVHSNNNRGVIVNAGTFTMQDTAAVHSNTNPNGGGGGVLVQNNGTFTMKNNATVHSNKANGAGAIDIVGGTFTMQNDTAVHSNTADNYNNRSSTCGGVYVTNGTFTMQDKASVRNNTATNSIGGVHINDGGTLTMKDNSSVHSNKANGNAGGVYIHKGTLNIQDNASIYNNNASDRTSNGGGVFITNNGSIIMQNSASIHGNTATATWNNSNGGGIYIENSTLTIQDNAVIRNNFANVTGYGDYGYGGGVYFNGGTFTLRDNASVHGNTASKGNGSGVYVNNGIFTMVNNTSIHSNTGNWGVYINRNNNNFGTLIIRDDASIYNHSGGVFNYGTFTMQGNTSVHTNNGRGVYNHGERNRTGIFTMQDKTTVHSNTTNNDGGGVYNSGTFVMQDNTSIYGNKATGTSSDSHGDGGGVYNSGNFTMVGQPSIYGNTSARNGGGVYNTGNDAVFRMAGGTILGYFEDADKRNNASDRSCFFLAGGTAQYGGFNGNNFISRGNLTRTDSTMKVENWVLTLDGNEQESSVPIPATHSVQSAQPGPLSGTYYYSSTSSIIFMGNNFTLMVDSGTYTGTYSISGQILNLSFSGNSPNWARGRWTGVDANTIRDPDGDLWRKR